MTAVEGSGGAGGVVLPLTMSGDGFAEAIYSLTVAVSSGSKFEMQIDCGSSDTWLASTSCGSSVCQRAGTPLYGWSGTTVDSQVVSEFNYLVGRVQGSIVWETLQLGNYTLANQVLLSAVQVENERLSSHFVGLIGLALEGNSLLVNQFQDRLDFPTSTFSTTLFSSSTPPTNRTIGISLERPEQSNSGTPSLLSIGRHPSSVVPDPSKIAYSTITDGTYWRLPVTEIAVWTVGDYNSTSGSYSAGTRNELTLGSSAASGVHSIWPLATLDTGGAQIITTRDLANMFWGSYGIGPASDGMYYVPCKTAINITLKLGTVAYPIHPLDMSYISSSDPYSGMCIGAWQASDTLYSADLVLGAAFLRNVYTVLRYDAPRVGVAQGSYDPSSARPQLGLMSLTSWEQGLKDFYRVRVLGEPLESTSSSGPSSGSSSGGSAGGVSSGTSTTEKSKKLSVGIMALIGIMVFFGVAAALFGARWWMMKRRWKHLRATQVQQGAEAEKDNPEEGGIAIPRPSHLNKDEEYERAHSAVYTRESVAWDSETATVVGSRANRAKNRKPGKTHSFAGSRVVLMGEWVEPDSDEEDEPGQRGSVARTVGSDSANRESWATVRPREVGELDVVERANRTMSLAGVGAGVGTKVHFLGSSVDYGRPISMPAEISQAAESSNGIMGVVSPARSERGLYHRKTYSRDSLVDEVGAPLLKGGSRSPLGKTSFLQEDLAIPQNMHPNSRPGISQLIEESPEEDQFARARPSVDVGLSATTDIPIRPSVDIPQMRNIAGDATPGGRGSMDIASPRSHWGQRG